MKTFQWYEMENLKGSLGKLQFWGLLCSQQGLVFSLVPGRPGPGLLSVSFRDRNPVPLFCCIFYSHLIYFYCILYSIIVNIDSKVNISLSLKCSVLPGNNIPMIASSLYVHYFYTCYAPTNSSVLTRLLALILMVCRNNVFSIFLIFLFTCNGILFVILFFSCLPGIQTQ